MRLRRRHSCCCQLRGRNAHVVVRWESCDRHAPAFGGAEEKESDALVLEGDGPNNQHNFVNQARKKSIITLINFILVFYPLSQLNCHQTDGIALPPQPPPPIKSPRLLSLLCRAHVLLVGCCVLLLIFGRLSSRCIFFSHQFSLINLTAKTMTRRPPARSAPVTSPL